MASEASVRRVRLREQWQADAVTLLLHGFYRHRHCAVNRTVRRIVDQQLCRLLLPLGLSMGYARLSISGKDRVRVHYVDDPVLLHVDVGRGWLDFTCRTF